MGLVLKPSMDQLMIGDFIREKKKLIKCELAESSSQLNRIKENTSDSNLVFNNKVKMVEEREEIKLRRRYTSKSGKADNIRLIKNQSSIGNIRLKQNNSIHKRTKSKHKGRIAKIKLRNPSNSKGT